MIFRDYVLWLQEHGRANNKPIDPLIWGKSIPGTEPVRDMDDYVPLTANEARVFYTSRSNALDCILIAHRAGWEHRRTPNG